jgi:hydroxymethylpyrimidine/phosphomethylpyrimidine kinase
MQTALTIAGFDPSSGAGMTADLMVFAVHGLFGTSCITALTVQSTLGVRSVHAISAEIVRETLECLEADLPPAGIKIGMIGTKHNLFVISEYVEKHNQQHSKYKQLPVVLDPVLKSTSGRELLEPEAVNSMRTHLLPAVDWITPNLHELAMLASVTIPNRADVPAVARRLQQQTNTPPHQPALGIIVTGGHLDSPDDYMLTPCGEEFWFPGVRVDTTSTHGTGCAFSSAFLSRLILGDTPFRACAAAKEYVSQALRAAPRTGHGTGPINYLWNVSNP